MSREEQIRKAADDYCGSDTREQSPCFYAHIHNAFLEGVEWADQHPHWIPVEEERPKFDWKDDGTWSSSLPILIYSIHGISIGTFQLDHITGKAYWLFDGSKHEEFMDKWRIVTHWMPLPEEPRKED